MAMNKPGGPKLDSMLIRLEARSVGEGGRSMSDHDTKLSRRDLLKAASIAGLGLTTSGIGSAHHDDDFETVESHGSRRGQETMIGVRFDPRDVLRIGIVGVGLRGTSILKEFLAIDKVVVNAVCDIVKEKCLRAGQMIEGVGQKAPAVYCNGERDFENLCSRADLDLIYIATPWEWHVPQILAGLNNGKHVGTEVPAAYTVEDCWKIVDASEKMRRHCLIMENCCYDHSQMMVLNMVRAGLFGELVHGECAYNHDLREILFENANEGLWRRRHHTLRDSNLYPTHGLGPMANYMNINRGDRFDHMISISSSHLGLEGYRKDHIPAGDPQWKEVYRCGDYNTSIIKTARGRTILLQHNVSHPDHMIVSTSFRARKESSALILRASSWMDKRADTTGPRWTNTRRSMSLRFGRRRARRLVS